jgi:hypothetical protein
LTVAKTQAILSRKDVAATFQPKDSLQRTPNTNDQLNGRDSGVLNVSYVSLKSFPFELLQLPASSDYIITLTGV